VESTPTVLFVIAEAPCAQSCASLLLNLRSGKEPSALSHQPSGKTSPAHAQLLDQLEFEGELLRSRLERKPVRSAAAAFATKAVRIS
jgi:hypothetical protein